MQLRMLLCAPVLAGALLLPPAAVQAQDGFLFRQPQGQLTLRAGPIVPRAQSDVFDFMTTELSLDRGDFRAPSLSAEVAYLVSPRFDVVVSFGWSESSTRSEYRDFIGDDGLPIEQTTSLRLLPLTASVRFLPLERGRQLSGLAWLPTSLTPYIGGGGGMTWYRLHQEGEFIDHRDGDIFLNEYESSGQGMTAHALAGVDYWFSPRIGVNLEGRYNMGSADVVGSFRSYDRIDLTGLQLGLGVSFRW